MRNVGHQRIIRVGIRQHRANRQQHLGDRQRGAPLVPQDIQTDRAVRVDVRVVDLRREDDLGRLERVVRRERDGEEEHAPCVRRVALFPRGIITDPSPISVGAIFSGHRWMYHRHREITQIMRSHTSDEMSQRGWVRANDRAAKFHQRWAKQEKEANVRGP